MIHPFVPILPADPIRLLAILDSAPSLLITAIQGLTYSTDVDLGLGLPDIQPSLPDIQSAVLFAYLFYSRGETDNARIMVQRASKCLLDLRWNLIDADHSAIASNEVSLIDVEDGLESIRRVWWECWALEIKLAVVTGIRDFFLADCEPHVNHPRQSHVDQFQSDQVGITALSNNENASKPFS